MTAKTFGNTQLAEIRPFRVEISQDNLDDLRRRINQTRWPERETVPDVTQGVQLSVMQLKG